MTITKITNIVSRSLLTSVLLFFFSLSHAQYSNPQSSPYTFDFVSGVSLPLGDFEMLSESGINSTFSVNKNFCDHISIALNTSYMSLGVNDNYGVSNDSWKAFSMSFGPQYHIDINKAFVQFYGNLGLSFITTPEIIAYYPQSDLISTNIEESNLSGINTRLGLKLGTEICDGLNFFVSTEYSTMINGNINYQSRDLSAAVSDAGRVDADLASEIPFENHSFSFSSVNVNFGIRIDLGSTKPRAQDHNTSRSNTTSSVKGNPDTDLDNDYTPRAQDHNASRSNTTSSVMSNPDTDLDEEDDNTPEAQDHNASRSNTTSSVSESSTVTPTQVIK